jgi:hypothetical protein
MGIAFYKTRRKCDAGKDDRRSIEMNFKMRFQILAYILSTAGIISAAPSLPVTKVPVTPYPSFTGPTNDAHAVMGQWFMNVATSKPEYRTHEFYDNISGSGGGSAGHLAISGRVVKVQSLVFRPDVIGAFDVEAYIYNDPPATTGWGAGTNRLQEHLATAPQYTNTLRNVIMTVDFAVIGADQPSAVRPESLTVVPYREDPNQLHILTTNQNYAGWYGYKTDSGWGANGGFFVPGWSFGDITAGTSTNRTLNFFIQDLSAFSGGMDSGDPRYGIIMDSLTNGTDIFINRSLSLKISEWISDPALDEGDAVATNSNVSVFHDTDADIHQVVSIASVKIQPSPLSITVYTTGSTNGISQQIMQVSTNLMTTNWMNIATNETAWPIPQTNSWSYTNALWPVQFYRIIQP